MKHLYYILLALLIFNFAGEHLAFLQAQPVCLPTKSIDGVVYCASSKNTTDLVAVELPPAVRDFTDEEIARRFKSLSTLDMPLPYRPKAVRGYINAYTWSKKELSGRILGWSKVYFPIIEGVLRRRGLPDQLKYLTIPESALNNKVTSHAGAMGLWQLMPGTARDMGLTVNKHVDERSDPYKSSEAAALYLERLYKRYDDWMLVIAAYNCGPGVVNRAIRKAGGVKDFWTISKYLPRETRGHVPAFLASVYWVNYHHDYDIPIVNPKIPSTFKNSDTLMVEGPLHFDALTRFTSVHPKELAFLNPNIKNEFIPKKLGKYPIRLPKTAIYNYSKQESTIQEFMADWFDDKAKKIDKEQNNRLSAMSFDKGDDIKQILAKSPMPANELAPSGKTLLKYEVKKGDNLRLIADWFDVEINQLKSWNKTLGLILGDEILVYVPIEDLAQYSQINDLSLAQKIDECTDQNTPPKNFANDLASAYAIVQQQPSLVAYTTKRGKTIFRVYRTVSEYTNKQHAKFVGMGSPIRLSVRNVV